MVSESDPPQDIERRDKTIIAPIASRLPGNGEGVPRAAQFVAADDARLE